MIANEAALTKYDSDVGDGDLGTGATRAAKSVLGVLNNQNLMSDLQKSMINISDTFSDGFGGSSGPLWGVFLSQGAT